MQTLISDQIGSRFEEQLKLVDTVSDMLGISIDIVYSLLKGEKTILFDEIVILASTFHLSFDDQFFNNCKTILSKDQYVSQ